MDRRSFLYLSAYTAIGLKLGLSPFGSESLAQTSLQPHPRNSISGDLVAACLNLERDGAYSRENYRAALVRLDLKTGTVTKNYIKMQKPHDVLPVKDNYLVLPNMQNGQPLHFTNFSSGEGKDVILDDRYVIGGHGFFDEKNNIVVVSVRDDKKGRRGVFAILDPDDHRLLDMIPIEGRSPHDIQLLDEDTLAVCNYNIESGYSAEDETGFMAKAKDGYSYLSLYDRKTFKLKASIPAYNNAMISHATVTKDGDLYGIGFQEYRDPEVEEWTNEDLRKKFQNFYSYNHSELSSQWPDIAKNSKLHREEKSLGRYGLPILPMHMSAGSNALDSLHFNDFHHRRAQSICYVKETNMVCMSFPYTDSVKLYNATTHESHDVFGRDLNLKEMRGICAIEGTPYLAIAGIRRGMTVIDTRTREFVQHFGGSLGRIIHMHHIPRET